MSMAQPSPLTGEPVPSKQERNDVLVTLSSRTYGNMPPTPSPSPSSSLCSGPPLAWSFSGELLFIGFLLVAVFSQVYRYRQVSNAMQRQQIKWAVFGLILYAVLLIGLSLLGLIPELYQPGSLFEVVLNTLYPLAALPLPLSIGIAILRY